MPPFCFHYLPSTYILSLVQSLDFERYHFFWGVGGGELLPRNRLIGMCCWMGSHFHDWIDCNGVSFPIELLEWGCTFLGL